MQFSFVLDRSRTDAIFLIRQLEEKYLANDKPMYFFVLFHYLLANMKISDRLMVSKRIGNGYTEKSWIAVGVHKGSVINLVLYPPSNSIEIQDGLPLGAPLF